MGVFDANQLERAIPRAGDVFAEGALEAASQFFQGAIARRQADVERETQQRLKESGGGGGGRAGEFAPSFIVDEIMTERKVFEEQVPVIETLTGVPKRDDAGNIIFTTRVSVKKLPRTAEERNRIALGFGVDPISLRRLNPAAQARLRRRSGAAVVPGLTGETFGVDPEEMMVSEEQQAAAAGATANRQQRLDEEEREQVFPVTEVSDISARRDVVFGEEGAERGPVFRDPDEVVEELAEQKRAEIAKRILDDSQERGFYEDFRTSSGDAFIDELDALTDTAANNKLVNVDDFRAMLRQTQDILTFPLDITDEERARRHGVVRRAWQMFNERRIEEIPEEERLAQQPERGQPIEALRDPADRIAATVADAGLRSDLEALARWQRQQLNAGVDIEQLREIERQLLDLPSDQRQDFLRNIGVAQ